MKDKRYVTLLLLCILCAYNSAVFASPFTERTFQGASNQFLDSALNSGVLITDVLVEGNRLIDEEEILRVISSQVGASFSKENIIKDLEAIDGLGYFIRDSIQATPEVTKDGVLIKIRIEENSPITGVNILGNSLITTEELTIVADELIAKPENVIKTSEVLERIEQKYKEKGYLLARVSGISLDPDGILTIKIDEGVIDKIVYKGNTKTKERFLKRLTPNSKTGQAYNEVLVVQDLRALNETGFFEDIKRKVEPSAENPEKYNLVIELKEKRDSSFGFGGGVNNLSGGFANVGFSKNNVFGEGEKISFNSQYGTGLIASTPNDDRFIANERTVQLEARYTDPFLFNTKTKFSAFANANTLASYQIDLARERSYRLGTSFTRDLGMNFSANLDLIGEKVDIDDFSDSNYPENLLRKNLIKEGYSKPAAANLAQQLRNKQLEDGNFLYFNPSLTFDTRDSGKDTMSGWHNQLSFGHALGIGNDSYTKLGVDVRKYIPIGKETTLAFNVRGAQSLFGDIPSFSQFRAGGIYGVRGYRPFTDLGIGSRSLLASAELRTNWIKKIPFIKDTALAENLKLVFFSDFGYVGGQSRLNRLYNRLDTAASVGVGLRANLPLLGPVRVDYGIPLLEPLWANNKSVFGRFNFGFDERF